MSPRRQRLPRAIWIVSALHVALLITYSMLFAPFRPPDEPQHLDLVRAVRRDVGYPRYDARNLSQPVVRALPLVRFDVPAVRSRDLPADAAPPRASRSPFRELGDDDVTVAGEPNQLPSHPPLYYAVAAGVQTVVGTLVPGAADWAFDREIAALRLLSVLLLAPLPLLAYAVTRRLRWSREAAITASLFPLAIPQLTHIGSSVSNDNLLTLLVGICTLLIARIATDDRSMRTAALLGAFAGLAMFTKAFALFLPLWIVLAHVVALRNGADRSGVVRRGAVALAVAFALGGWWWLRNLVVFGTLQTSIKLLPPAPPGFRPDNRWWLGRFGSFMVERYWGWFGWFDVRIHPGVAAAATAGVGVAVVAAVIGAGKWRPARRGLVLLLVPTVTILTMVLIGAHRGYVRTGFDEGLQGRYLFPGIVGLAPLVGLGVTTLARRRAGRAPLMMLGVVVGMQAIAVATILGFYWGGDGLGQLGAVRAWSPWPPVVFDGVAVAAIVLAAVLARELALLGRRRLGPMASEGPVLGRQVA